MTTPQSILYELYYKFGNISRLIEGDEMQDSLGDRMSQWDLLRHECPKLYEHGVIFECGSGWYKIICDLSIKIEKILEERAELHKLVEGEECEKIEMFAVQVKEKYGTLRFYMSCETDEITNFMDDAEALSSQTCENCGAFGKMRGTSWYEVKCDQCYKERS